MKKPELKTLYYGISQNQERTIDHYGFWEWFWGQRIWKGGAGDKDDTFLRETRHSKKKKKGGGQTEAVIYQLYFHL